MTSTRTRAPAGPALPASMVPASALAVTPVLALVVALAGLAATGQLAAAELLDPGAVVRYGLPAVRVLHDLAACAAVGLLVLAAVAVPDPSRDRWALTGARLRMVRLGGVAASVWAGAGVVGLVLGASDVSGVRLGESAFGEQLQFFALRLELGRFLLVSVLLVVLAAHLALLATRPASAAGAAVVAVAALLPLALGGHAAGSNDHMNAVNSLAGHLVGVTVWVGGVVALLVLPRLSSSAPVGPPAQRFSLLAGWCFGLVALSGLDSAWLRLGGSGTAWAGLGTGYGVLLLVKTAALLLLGLAGWWHRRATLVRLAADPSDRGAFARLLAGEVVVMGVAVGAAVALARTPPPTPQQVTEGPDAGFRALVGFAPPPPLDLGSLLTQWYADRLLLAGCLVLAAGYLAWVRRVRSRGTAWPPALMAAWLAGCVLLAWLTSGGPTVYGMVSFAGHMVLHLMLALVAPVLLVLGAPATLARQALPARTDASAGALEWLDRAARSRAVAVLLRPWVAAVLLVGGIAGFYRTDAFTLAMSTHSGHMLMIGWFLPVGCLFATAVLRGTTGLPVRVGVTLAAGAANAVLLALVAGGSQLLAAPWWQRLGLTDRAALLRDQHLGGTIGWVTAGAAAAGLAVILVQQERAGREPEMRTTA